MTSKYLLTKERTLCNLPNKSVFVYNKCSVRYTSRCQRGSQDTTKTKCIEYGSIAFQGQMWQPLLSHAQIEAPRNNMEINH